MTIRPRTIDPLNHDEDQRSALARPLSERTANPLFQGWGPKL